MDDDGADIELIVWTAVLGVLGVACSYLFYTRTNASGANSGAASYTTPVARKVEEAKKTDAPPMTVFSGSQTGTAEDMSEKFAKEMKRHGFDAKAVDMEVFEMDGMELLSEEKLVVFFTATHGEGDPTDNARSFYEYLDSKDRAPDELKGLKFAVFGLGNRQYEQYNSMGRFFDKRMEELGATRVGQYGEGDDDEDIEADYDAWKDGITPILKEEFGCDSGEPVGAAELEFSLATVSNKATADAVEKGMNACFVSASVKSVIDNQVWLPGEMVVKKELQTNSDRSTLHIEIKPTGQGDYSFAPGDHIGVRSENNPKTVGALGTRLGLDLKQVVSLRSVDPTASKPFRFPSPCTIQVALSAWLDIETPARPEFLSFVARYASDAAEKEELSKLGSAEGKEAYSSTIQDKRLNLIDLLDKFKSLLIPAGALLELLPRLQTRFYSISSSLREKKNSIHLTAAVVRYPSALASGAADREGVATTWFERMRVGHSIQLCMRSAGFHLPDDKTKPVVMVGPGTGLAPFRGYIQEYQAMRRSGVETGPMVLFFGCRSSKQDYIYQEELEAAKSDGTISHLFTAFSRDQPEKVYVQHLIAQQAQLLATYLLKDGGSFYICGDAASMATQVNDTLIDVFKTAGGLDQEGAVQKIKDMKHEKRYLTDVWA